MPLQDPPEYTAAHPTAAWFCAMCGRMEDNDGRKCPNCGEKRQRCSRYEWFLADALRDELTRRGRTFRITEQYEMPDHRGFSWYFDLAVRVNGSTYGGQHTELIEVNGSDHARQKTYRGPGGGYTRDDDKHWEAFSNNRLHKKGFDIRTVDNDDCRLRVVKATAARIATEIIQRADFGA